MVREFNKLIAPYARRIRLMAGRGIIRLVNDAAKEQETQLSLLADEVRDKVERYQHYGFTSHPHADGEAVYVSLGGSRDHVVIVADGDRRYRLKGLASGEVALYDDQGQVIKLKRGKEIHVYGCDKLTADVAVETRVTSPLVTVVAVTKVLLDTPLTELTGDLLVAGGITSSGTYGASGGKIQTPGDIKSTNGQVGDSVRNMSQDRAIYTGHTHPGDSGGTTGTPNQGM